MPPSTPAKETKPKTPLPNTAIDDINGEHAANDVNQITQSPEWKQYHAGNTTLKRQKK
jgi:hypothetical protein